MLQLLSRYKGIIVVGVLLAMPVLLLYAQTKRPSARGPVVGIFIDVAALVERGLLWSVGGIMDGIEHYVTSVLAADELAKLRREENSATQLRNKVAELEQENEQLRALARAVEGVDGPRPIGARVIGRSGAPLTRLFTLDVGSVDGVKRGDGVVDKDGAVGLVLSVGRRSCSVLLLSDSSSAIDVLVQRTRARGILRGAGLDDRYAARVEDFDKLRDVRPGDPVVTSGLGARFPPGVLVGTVEEATAPDDSLYLRALVRPSSAFDRVEHVSVLIDRTPPRAPRLGQEAGGAVPGEEVAKKAAGGKAGGGSTARPQEESSPSAAPTPTTPPVPPAITAPPVGSPPGALPPGASPTSTAPSVALPEGSPPSADAGPPSAAAPAPASLPSADGAAAPPTPAAPGTATEATR